MPKNNKPMQGLDRLENDETFMTWFNEGFNKRNTQLSYRYGLRCYCDFVNMNPTELIDEAKKDYIDRVPPWELRHVKRIEAFINFLKTKKGEMAANTKLNYIKSVKHFYEFNKIPLILKQIGITQAAREDYLDIPQLKIEDVRKAAISTGTNKFLKAYILTTLSSGQGQNEVRTLKGKHLKNIVNGVAVVNMTRGKTQRRYFFFIGQEALDAIKEYKPEIKENDFIFTKKNSNEALTPAEIDTYFSRHAKKLGLDRAYFAPHRFRHYFKTVLTGNMEGIFVEYLMGHKLSGVESSYFLGNQNKMLEQYLKNQHLLTVFTDKEILQKQYDELKQKYDSGTLKIEQENEELKARIAKLEQFVLQDAGKQS